MAVPKNTTMGATKNKKMTLTGNEVNYDILAYMDSLKLTFTAVSAATSVSPSKISKWLKKYDLTPEDREFVMDGLKKAYRHKYGKSLTIPEVILKGASPDPTPEPQVLFPEVEHLRKLEKWATELVGRIEEVFDTMAQASRVMMTAAELAMDTAEGMRKTAEVINGHMEAAGAALDTSAEMITNNVDTMKESAVMLQKVVEALKPPSAE